MAHRRILTAAQRRAFFALPADDRTCARHHTLSDEDLLRIRRRRKPENRLGFALQLCALRYPGRLLQPGELIPEAMLRAIAGQIGEGWRGIEGYGVRENTRYEHSAALQAEFGYRPFIGAARAEMIRRLDAAALEITDAHALAESFMATLRAGKVIAPAPSTFEKLCSSAVIKAERVVIKRLIAGLSPRHVAAFDQLLQVAPGARLTPLGGLRAPIGAVGAAGFRDLVARIVSLRALGPPKTPGDVSPKQIAKLGRECERISVGHLGAMAPPRRYALLMAFAQDRLGRLTDAAIDMTNRMISGLFKRAERRHLDALEQNRRSIGEIVRHHADFGAALIAARDAGDDPLQAIGDTLGWEAFERSVDAANKLRTPIGADRLERIEGEYPRLRRFGPLLLRSFTFRGVAAMTPLLSALDILRRMDADRMRSLPTDAPMTFVPPRWRRLIADGAGLNRKVYEICAFSRLRDALRAGEIWVPGAHKYRSFDAQLLPPAAIARVEPGGAIDAVLRHDPDTWLAGRRERMNMLLRETERLAAAGALPDAAVVAGRLSVTPLSNATPDAARSMARRLYALLPRVRITDLLEEVDAWTGMSDCFGHLRTGHPPKDRRALYAALIADGLNLGLTRMAQACEDASYWRLARLVDWHIREDTYALATRTLVDAQDKAPFAHLWGDGTTSSSDGQHFHAGGPARAVTDANARYGTEPGVKFYTHISDRFAAFHIKAIAATAPEAPYVLDGLLQHEARAPIREHHTDTGGFTDHVFALCALLGFRFAPRIRDLPDKRLYVFDGAPATPTLAPMITRHARDRLVRANWPDVIRLAATIRAGNMTAAHAVTALAATSRQSGLAAALAEIGRIERSIFMLEWMLQPDLRHRVQMSLNKGEAQGNLARAVFFNRLGQIRDRSYENHQHRAAGANLVVAAIIAWNTVYLGRAAQTLRMSGQDVPDETLRHIWPLAWDHINLTGDYRWSAKNPDSLENLRPLRLDRLPPATAA